MSITLEHGSTPFLAGETWSLDGIHSSIGFSVLYMGVAPFEGAFREVDATLDADGLRGTTTVASIDVDDENLAGHLASPDFFDAAAYPTLSFESDPLAIDGEHVSVDGTLEIRGNRLPVRLTGTITQPVSDPWGNRKVGLTLTGRVDRTAFGLTWNAPLPEGGQMLADEVDLTARLVFVAQPQEA